jgi:hypothetical protein
VPEKDSLFSSGISHHGLSVLLLTRNFVYLRQVTFLRNMKYVWERNATPSKERLSHQWRIALGNCLSVDRKLSIHRPDSRYIAIVRLIVQESK